MPRKPNVPTAGFDDDVSTPQAASAPVAVLEAPAPAVAPPAETAPSSAEFLAEMQRLRDENSKLQSLALEALQRKADDAKAAPPPPPTLETRKLYFTGTRVNEQGFVEPDLVATQDGGAHICGRGDTPIVFKGTPEDRQPHAFVHQTFGDWLIAEDAPRDNWGRPVGTRYRWAEG